MRTPHPHIPPLLEAELGTAERKVANEIDGGTAAAETRLKKSPGDAGAPNGPRRAGADGITLKRPFASLNDTAE